MTGSLHVKKDRYYMVINCYDEGKRKQKWISTGLEVRGNKRRAERMLSDTLRDLEAEKSHRETGTDVLFSDTVREWLELSRIRVDAITYQGYKVLADVHVIPYFEEKRIKLIDVDRSVLQQYINEKSSNGRVDGKGGLSASSMMLHKNVLYQTCKKAVLDGMIPSNPCEGVQIPKRERINYHYYSAEQITKLLKAARTDVLYPVILVTSVYGLRRSEVLGLQWDSVDFDNNIITIAHTVTKVSERVEKDKTKNKSSHRSYPLLPDIKDVLLSIKSQENKNRSEFGLSYKENQFVFKWPDGTPFNPDYITHHFSKLLKQNDLPHIRFHELRHSCASIMIVSGMTLKDVQEWLGHSRIDVTADIYAHIDIQRKVSVGNKIATTIGV